MKSIVIAIILAVSATSAFAFHTAGGGNGKKVAASVKPSFAFSLNSNVTKSNPLGLSIGIRKPLRIKSNTNTIVGLETNVMRPIGVKPIVSVVANTSYQFNITHQFSIAPIAGFGLLTAPIASEMNGVANYNTQLTANLGIQPSMQIFRGNGLKANVFMRYEFAHVSNAAMFNNLVPLTMMKLGISFKVD
jgi:hypothetical protein